MNRLFIAGIAAVAGLLLNATPARALSLTANAMNPISSGSYNVTINQVSPTQYSVTVTGNNDGRLVADPSGPQKHSVGRISIGFLRGDNTYIMPNGPTSSGGTNSGGAYTGSAWVVTALSDVVRFNAPSIGNDVGAFGENSFTGTLFLTAPEAPARVTAALQNGTQQWYTEGNFLGGQGDLTPEPASLALALPGLLPLAMLLRRRRKTA